MVPVPVPVMVPMPVCLRLIDMAETKINKLPVLERRLHNYGHGMDFRSLSGKDFFTDRLPGASQSRIKATKEGAAGLKVGSLAGKQKKKR